MPNEIRADMLKVKRMISEVEMIIGKREGETKLVNKLIDAENLLTYCMSRLENAVVPPCKVGDTVYVITTCANVHMSRDDDYYTGTGAVECPFEHDCEFIDCSDDNSRIFETICTGFMFDHEDITNFHTFFKDINAECSDDCWGKSVFLTRYEAEQALKEGADNAE